MNSPSAVSSEFSRSFIQYHQEALNKGIEAYWHFCRRVSKKMERDPVTPLCIFFSAALPKIVAKSLPPARAMRVSRIREWDRDRSLLASLHPPVIESPKPSLRSPTQANEMAFRWAEDVLAQPSIQLRQFTSSLDGFFAKHLEGPVGCRVANVILDGRRFILVADSPMMPSVHGCKKPLLLELERRLDTSSPVALFRDKCLRDVRSERATLRRILDGVDPKGHLYGMESPLYFVAHAITEVTRAQRFQIKLDPSLLIELIADNPILEGAWTEFKRQDHDTLSRLYIASVEACRSDPEALTTIPDHNRYANRMLVFSYLGLARVGLLKRWVPEQAYALTAQCLENPNDKELNLRFIKEVIWGLRAREMVRNVRSVLSTLGTDMEVVVFAEAVHMRALVKGLQKEMR